MCGLGVLDGDNMAFESISFAQLPIISERAFNFAAFLSHSMRISNRSCVVESLGAASAKAASFD